MFGQTPNPAEPAVLQSQETNRYQRAGTLSHYLVPLCFACFLRIDVHILHSNAISIEANGTASQSDKQKTKI